jgi:septal ring factor EnvC (AmiA/AmiB activator)
MSANVFSPLRSWPIAIAVALFGVGLSFVWGYHQGQQQTVTEQLTPMAAELDELQTLLNTQQRERQQQLRILQEQLAEQQTHSTQSSSAIEELEQALLRLHADYDQLVATYQLLQTQFAEREALIQQWLRNSTTQNP